MTRSTRVAVTSPGIDPMEMWRAMATILCAPEQYRFTVAETAIHANLGQGLDALMDLDFTAVRFGEQQPAHDQYCDPGCESEWCFEPAHYLMADFDTAYGATDSCGCHSGGIHIRLVSGLGEWLNQHGATWQWYDESGYGWRHADDWGTLGDPREACPQHRAIPAPRSAVSA